MLDATRTQDLMKRCDPDKPLALGLFSGGLDSICAALLMRDLGFEVISLHFTSPFDRFGQKSRKPANHDQVQEAAKAAGLILLEVEKRSDYLEILVDPKHGYGSAFNPCIDCRIHMLRQAKEIMDELGAVLIFTGEVVEQRPMSQHREAMDLVEEESGLKGRLLRPLSAANLEPTQVERDGLVDRSRLLGLSGRSRDRQRQMLKDHGIDGFDGSGGGCLLTDPMYGHRAKDMHRYEQGPFDYNDYELLAVGRHYRIQRKLKVVVGRDRKENHILQDLARPEDTLLKPANFPGPVALLRGDYSDEALNLAVRLVATHGKPQRGAEALVNMRRPSQAQGKTLVAGAKCLRRELQRYRVEP